jgi:hypothetical protein
MKSRRWRDGGLRGLSLFIFSESVNGSFMRPVAFGLLVLFPLILSAEGNNYHKCIDVNGTIFFSKKCPTKSNWSSPYVNQDIFPKASISSSATVKPLFIRYEGGRVIESNAPFAPVGMHIPPDQTEKNVSAKKQLMQAIPDSNKSTPQVGAPSVDEQMSGLRHQQILQQQQEILAQQQRQETLIQQQQQEMQMQQQKMLIQQQHQEMQMQQIENQRNWDRMQAETERFRQQSSFGFPR